jgi:3-hydroxyisobutyrate dehydrogenase-like beta-hydroxyacid dehydrogenase
MAPASTTERVFVRILNSTYFKTGISENKGPKIVNNDYTASFHLMNMVKDLDLALRTAYTAGLTLPTTASAEAVYVQPVPKNR